MISKISSADAINQTEKNKPSIPLFAKPRSKGQYLFDELSVDIPEGNICIPIAVDTEFNSHPVHHTKGSNPGRQGITTQVKGIAAKEAIIMAHPGVAHLLPRFSIANFGFHPVVYLRLLGFEAAIYHCQDLPVDTRNFPICEFTIYAHFALAEMCMITSDKFLEDVVRLFKAKKGNRFEMQRQLKLVSGGIFEQDSVLMPWVLALEGVYYRVKLCVIDTCALHGNASYKELAEATGVKLLYKDNFTAEEKSDMLRMAIERPDDFDQYAIDDTRTYEILVANANNYRKVYVDLGLSAYYRPPKLTMGSTVNQLFEAALKNRLGVDDLQWNWLLENLIEPTSTKYLKENAQSTSALLSIVSGGRCRNNRPNALRIINLLVDLDIDGCYADAQRSQDFPIGIPEIIQYDPKSSCNEYLTLEKILKEYGFKDPENPGELVPGCFKFVGSTLEKLKIPQDWFPSRTIGGKPDLLSLAKYAKSAVSDSEKVATDFNNDEGQVKIFNHEIHNTEVTWDSLEWLWYVTSPQQRKELLEKIHVTAGLVYPRSFKADTIEEVLVAHQNHEGKNKNRRKGKGKKARRIFEDGECHAWCSFNLGDLLIDDLMANRKLYPKKTPLNTLFKLNANTLYGDMVSSFFSFANAVVGSNITARARALAWYMEKGLYGFQTITDGCAFEPNNVPFPKKGRRFTAVEGVNYYRKFGSGNGNVFTAPLGSQQELPHIGKIEKIELSWYSTEADNNGQTETIYEPILILRGTKGSKTYQGDEASKWINRMAMEHLQNLFPDVSILHAKSTVVIKPDQDSNERAIKRYDERKGQFSFEAKGFYDEGVFQGASNYRLKNPNGEVLRYRAYETKKPHESVDENLQVTDRYGEKNNPAKDFIHAIDLNPSAVPRQPPFVKSGIIKPSDYKNRINTWEPLGLKPGDSYYKAGLLREFSLSQFTFNTLEQFTNWEKAIKFHKDRYGQSIEMFFLNEDGTLNYQSMVEVIDGLITEDCLNPFDELSKSRNLLRTLPHPDFDTYIRLKTALKTPSNRPQATNT